jgi:hypothetical protein
MCRFDPYAEAGRGVQRAAGGGGEAAGEGPHGVRDALLRGSLGASPVVEIGRIHSIVGSGDRADT